MGSENYIKMLDENKLLKKKIEEINKINNTNNIILLTAENDRLKNENAKLIKNYNKLVRNPKTTSESSQIIEEIVNNENIIKSFARISKNKDGKYNIDGTIYDTLFGSRTDVWEGKSYKTAGCLTKNDLLINKNGNIISKKKCIQSTMVNHFEKYGVNKPTTQ